eukprot:COSAG02_NODE_14447_length_1271_cov_0.918942_1_plen_153_part_10
MVGRKVEHESLDVLKLGEVGGKLESLVVSLWQGPLLDHTRSHTRRAAPNITPNSEIFSGRDSCLVTHLHWVEVLDVVEVDIIAVQESFHIGRVGVCLCRADNRYRLEFDRSGELDSNDQLHAPARGTESADNLMETGMQVRLPIACRVSSRGC